MYKNSIIGKARNWLFDIETVESSLISRAWFWLDDIKNFEKFMIPFRLIDWYFSYIK